MSQVLNFGLIGCGEIAVQTSKAILGSQVARVVHCMDLRGDLAAELASKHDARHTTKVEDLLADEKVQAVVISSPHWLHSPLAVQAARAGKHVLSEKPIACTLAQADEMIAAAKAAGVQLGVLMPQRLTFPWTKARELIAAGAIGQIHSAKIHFMANKPATYWHGGFTGRAKDDWRLSMDKSGGGVTVMNLVHDLDSMSSVLDLRPKRVYAEYATLATPGEVEDFINVVMALESGAILSMDASSAAVGGESHGDRIYGSKGQLHMGWDNIRVYLVEPYKDIEAGKWVEFKQPADWVDTRQAAVDSFARAILEGRPVPVDGMQGRRILEIIRGAYLSMQRGRPEGFPVKE
jgi:predicted dehydrogenase